MFLQKLKRVVFLTLSISIVLFTLWISFYIGWLVKPGTGAISSFLIKSLLGILCTGVILFLVMLITMAISDGSKNIPFIVGVVYLFSSDKWIYHAELGYFLAIFQGNKMTVYKQNFLSMKEVAEIDIYGINNDELSLYVAKNIKSKLDELYQSKLKKLNARKEEKSRIDHLKEWDGYLDTVGRRDGKIKDLLG